MSAYQVNKRHAFLQRLIYVNEEEVTSYENMNTCVITVTACVCMFSIMEVVSYFLYLFKVQFYSIIYLYLFILNIHLLLYLNSFTFQFHPWIKILGEETTSADVKTEEADEKTSE